MLKRVRLTSLLDKEIEAEIMNGHMPEAPNKEKVDKALKYARKYLSTYTKKDKKESLCYHSNCSNRDYIKRAPSKKKISSSVKEFY